MELETLMFTTRILSTDDGPDAKVSVDIGSIGIVLFTFLVVLCAYAYYLAVNKYSKALFFFAIVYSVLELPRYIALVIQQKYDNLIAYVIHMQGKYSTCPDSIGATIN